MQIVRERQFIILVCCFIILPCILYAQPSEVPDAQWTSVDNFKYCNGGNCETFRKIELSSNSIEKGKNISVINLNTNAEITTFVVKSIKYGRQVKMCWIGDSEGMISESYITVKGCNR